MSDIIESSEFQNVASAAIGIAGLLLAHAAISVKRFNRYGRESLFLAACFFIITAVVRFLFEAGWIETHQARSINAFAALVICILLIQAGYLGALDRKLE